MQSGKKRKVFMILLSSLAAIALLGLFFSRGQSRVNTITPEETYKRSQADTTVVLLDVRTPEEHAAGHITNSILIPVQELERRTAELLPYKGKTIIAYCRSGNRSGVAAEMLGKSGYTVLNMEGGMIRWKNQNLPVEQGPAK